MSLARAQQIVARSSQSAGFNSALREMLKEVLEEVYSDMSAAGAITIVPGDNVALPLNESGSLLITVDSSDPTNIIIGLAEGD